MKLSQILVSILLVLLVAGPSLAQSAVTSSADSPSSTFTPPPLPTVEPSKRIWKTPLATALILGGLGGLGYGFKLHQDMGSARDAYDKLGSGVTQPPGPSQQELSAAWKKVTDAHDQRNQMYMVGAAVLMLGIVVAVEF